MDLILEYLILVALFSGFSSLNPYHKVQFEMVQWHHNVSKLCTVDMFGREVLGMKCVKEN